MPEPSPVVDVLIPAYNAAETLESAVASIQRQTLDAIRIHIVDDGSTDETPLILDRLSREDPRIRVHRKPNGGIVDALNVGLDSCDAEFLARHDADDLAHPERLATQVAYLRGHPDVVAVGAVARHIDSDGKPLGTFADLASPDLADCEAVPAREPYIVHPLLTVRLRALRRAGGYRYVVHSEDSDLYWRLAEIGRLVNLPDVLADYRMHHGSISGASAANGRIMAVSSQLAGISARRRRAGLPDLAFPRDRLPLLEQADGIAAVVEVASMELSGDERAHLRRAAAAKLLELTTYRPYDLSMGDALFIRRSLGDGLTGVSAERRSVLRRHISGAAARLAAKGEWAVAWQMLPRSLIAGFLARTAMRVAIPPPFHRFLQRRGTRAALGH